MVISAGNNKALTAKDKERNAQQRLAAEQRHEHRCVSNTSDMSAATWHTFVGWYTNIAVYPEGVISPFVMVSRIHCFITMGNWFASQPKQSEYHVPRITAGSRYLAAQPGRKTCLLRFWTRGKEHLSWNGVETWPSKLMHQCRCHLCLFSAC